MSPPPPSFLLLPAGGDESAAHFHSSVEVSIDPAVLPDWMPAEDALAVRERVTNRLAAWGLRDNTKALAGSGVQPIIWDRIAEGTLALFSNSEEYFCHARVIGKAVSELASEQLWRSPEFRWLILLTDVREVSIPLGVVLEGARFAPTYRINRQAQVPKAHREATLWEAISGDVVTPGTPDRVELVPPEGVATESFEVSGTEPHEARRTEAELVEALREWWTQRDGSQVVWRLAIQPGGTGARLYADLFNETTRELVEAKADADRDSVRMAIGQLADYRRFVEGDVVCKVLLPAEPLDDLAELLAREGIGILVPDADGFRDVPPISQAR